jgi:hypothetical protein
MIRDWLILPVAVLTATVRWCSRSLLYTDENDGEKTGNKISALL